MGVPAARRLRPGDGRRAYLPKVDNSGARYKRAISRGQEIEALYIAERDKVMHVQPAPLNYAALSDRFRTLASEFCDLAEIFGKTE